jgi:hypothetical protein
MDRSMSRYYALSITVVICSVLFVAGCSVPNALSHSHDYYGSLQSKSPYRYKIKHTLERSPVYLIGGIGAALVGVSQLPSGSPARVSGSSSSSGNSMLALSGIGLGAYCLYTWFNLNDEPQPFSGSGEVHYFTLDGRPLGSATLSGDILTFQSKPPERVLIELHSGERVMLDLEGRLIE